MLLLLQIKHLLGISKQLAQDSSTTSWEQKTSRDNLSKGTKNMNHILNLEHFQIKCNHQVVLLLSVLLDCRISSVGSVFGTIHALMRLQLTHSLHIFGISQALSHVDEQIRGVIARATVYYFCRICADHNKNNYYTPFRTQCLQRHFCTFNIFLQSNTIRYTHVQETTIK